MDKRTTHTDCARASRLRDESTAKKQPPKEAEKKKRKKNKKKKKKRKKKLTRKRKTGNKAIIGTFVMQSGRDLSGNESGERMHDVDGSERPSKMVVMVRKIEVDNRKVGTMVS